MFGFGDLGVTLAILLALGATLLCVGWGLARWNAPDAPTSGHGDRW
jgi:hypothetical protein